MIYIIMLLTTIYIPDTIPMENQQKYKDCVMHDRSELNINFCTNKYSEKK